MLAVCDMSPSNRKMFMVIRQQLIPKSCLSELRKKTNLDFFVRVERSVVARGSGLETLSPVAPCQAQVTLNQ